MALRALFESADDVFRIGSEFLKATAPKNGSPSRNVLEIYWKKWFPKKMNQELRHKMHHFSPVELQYISTGWEPFFGWGTIFWRGRKWRNRITK
jgi:hypothetical protein